MAVVVSAFTLRARNLLRRGEFSRVANVVYPSVKFNNSEVPTPHSCLISS